MELIFIETPEFASKYDRLATQEEMVELQDDLIKNPEKGSLVRGTGGARKIRMRLKRQGKRGGARVIYYYMDLKGEVWFLEIYAKSEKPNLTESDKKKMYRFIKETIK